MKESYTNPIQNRRQRILKFYKTFIEEYILHDIHVLKSIKPDPKTGLGGCTIPLAMSIISTSDLLGFLLNKNGEVNKSSQNIEFFLNFENLFPSYYDSDAVEKICNYRQGMMHHFFPKFKSNIVGICKNYKSNALFIKHADEENFYSLNINVFVDDFLNAIDNLKIILEKTKDEILLDSIIKGLKNLDKSLNISSSTKICTTIYPGTPKGK